MAPSAERVRVAELCATLSYAADLGLGQPMTHSMRQTVIALRLAELVGASLPEREATYYLGLLISAYCHADAAEQARWFGDDIAFKADAFDLLGKNPAQASAFLARRVSSHGSWPERMRRIAALPAGMKQIMGFLSTHAQLLEQFAQQIGLEQSAAFGQAYEQWDGKGVPLGLRGTEIELPARLVHLAAPVEVYARRHGIDAVRSAVRRSSAEFDPTLVALFCANADQLLAGLDEASDWTAIIAAEPALTRWVEGERLDAALEAMADLVDLKSPCFAGHSRGVANLAAAAGRSWGLPESEVILLRRAGLLHDLGRLGISNAIWDKPGPLSRVEKERVRMHPYLTERMLAGIDNLAAAREVAGRHHERLDGSGYPRGLTAASLRPIDRLLAVADAFHTSRESRPHREACSPERAAAQLTAEVRAGRLDGSAVELVLETAGRPSPRRRSRPDALTSREVEILSLLARGATNKQVAGTLTIASKTVGNHVEHIYTKIGVSNRAAATLYAIQRGLVGAFEETPRRDQVRHGH